MAGSKKFGTFGGVFTPSILTILGVIMYMRLGWVVGNAGLYGTILIILIAHIISVTTGLSISSIATDKRVGAGGVYYVLSRSLGLPIGGAIGVTLFAGTALSIALYLVGFAESFNAYLGLDTTINGLRIGGTIALVTLAIIALISTAVAIKTQYFILAAIVISLISIFTGSWEFAPAMVPSFGGEDSVAMETVFAIFFPAVTGFTAGIAMSGDLKDPKKSIPGGTIAAIVVGFLVYTILAVFIAHAIDPATLRSDYNILMKISVFAPAVAAGIWGATLSSALGGILGGPRILQAMSVDKITPYIFSKGVGKDNEPRNALFITLMIAECGVLIGELDLIARVVSMFYLAAYGFINLSFFLESWASADFSPTFKVKRWIGLLGFMATFAVMFKLDMIAMFAAFIIIGGIYAYLQRKQLALGSGDIWRSVWSSLVLTGLKRMDKSEDVARNWIPNILLFSGSVKTRPHLIEIAKGIAGKVGMISNFHLVENPEAKVLFPKHKQSLRDPILIENGIFGRQQEVQNVYKGIETIASTYGFSGVEPNTVLLGWAKNTKDPLMFAQMTQKLIELDYNVLYLDYDWDKKFGKYQRIDIWWLNLKNNIELTLNIVKFISNSPQWQKARIRVLLINDTNKEGFERMIHQHLDAFRIDARVKVINNYLEKRSSFDLMKNNSKDADLILAGIPNIPPGEEKGFVDNTTEMFGILGTTLLVKTSSMLGVDETNISDDSQETEDLLPKQLAGQLVPLQEAVNPEAKEPARLISQELEEQSMDIAETEIASFQNIYNALVNDCRKETVEVLETYFSKRKEVEKGATETINIRALQREALKIYLEKIDRFEKEDLPYLEEKLLTLHKKYNRLPKRILKAIPEKIRIEGKRLALRKIVRRYFATDYCKALHDIQHQLGYIGFQLNEDLKDSLIQSIRAISSNQDSLEKCIERVNTTFDELLLLIKQYYFSLSIELRNSGRTGINTLLTKIDQPFITKDAKDTTYPKKVLKNLVEENATFKEYWQRNQKFLAAKLTTDIQLQGINLQIDQIGQGIQQEMYQAMFHNTALRLAEAEEWWNAFEQNPVISAADLPEVNQSLAYDDQKIEELMTMAGVSGKVLPAQLELIDPDSLHNFSQVQGEELRSVTIDAQTPYSYLIYEKLQQPLQKHLLTAYQACMEVLSKVQYDINQVVQKMNYLKEEIAPEELTRISAKAKAHIAELREELTIHKDNKTEALGDILHTVTSVMNTASLLEYAVRILPSAQIGASRKGIKKWLGDASNIASTLVDKYGDIKESQYGAGDSMDGHGQLSSVSGRDMHYELKRFVNGLEADQQVADKLPFYYKQLFIGKQAPSIDQLHFRKQELQQAFSMLRSPNTDEHAIIVLGEPFSGKSYFSEVVARGMRAANLVKIQPPINGSTNITDFIKVLQKQLKSTTSSIKIMDEAAKGTIFLFGDLELWWNRSNPDGKLIRTIVKLINSYKSDYSFILNCNVYAFKIMEGQGLLDDLTASKVYLNNFDQAALQRVLLERHKAGGLLFNLQGVDQDEVSNKNIRKLMSKYLQNSRGIVGIALHQWISNIKAYEDDQIEIDFPEERSLPILEDKDWLVILSQFLIHKHLDAVRLQKLFAYPDRSQADLIISQLSADGIIKDIMGSTYKLNPLAVVWVINRAEQFSLI